jgi:acyl dehydratase
MPAQTYFEDVEVGAEIPPLEKLPTTQQLVKYAGASGDFNPIHYDKDHAIASKLPGVIVHGALKNAFLGQLMTDFAGELGWLRRLSVQYRGMDVPGVKLVARGKVTGKRIEGADHLVECEVWLENEKGDKTTPGRATVILPSRAK